MVKQLFARVLLLVAGVLILAMPVMTQDGLVYDEPVTGELSDAASAVDYTFTGNAGDVIFITCQRTSYDDNMDEPKVILVSPAGDEIVNNYGFSSAKAAVQLPEDGDYTLTVTREDEESTGEYQLAVALVPELLMGKQFTASLTSEETAFYFVKGGEPFTVTYIKTGGDFHPSLGVNLINDGSDGWSEAGSLRVVGVVEGAQVNGGMVIISGESDLYIITLAEAIFDFNFSTVTADYIISVAAFEQ